MKKLTCVAVVAMTALLIASCGNSRTSLCPAKAKRVVQAEAAQTGLAEQGLVVPIGFFECNNAYTRYQLRQLAACGIVSYECVQLPRVTLHTETQSVSTKVRGRVRTTHETYTVADTEWCCFVDVKLAPAGEALLMSCSDDEMVDRDLCWTDNKTYPEDEVDYVEFANPDADCYDEEEEEGEMDSYDAYDGEEAGESVDDEYLSAKQRETIEWVRLRAFGVRVAKVRDVRIYEQHDDEMTYPMAQGEAIVELHDVTPVGRVVAGRYNGMRLSLPCLFAYYEGDGWRIDNLDADAVFAVSSVSMQDLDHATELQQLTQEDIVSQSAIDD